MASALSPPPFPCARRTLSPPPFPCARRTLSPPLPRAAQISNGPLSPSPLLLPRALIEIQKSRVIACLRAQDGMLALEAARAALKGGISVLEIVTSTPCIFEVIKELVQEHPSSIIGVGTVLNTEDAINAVHAGAKFVMSPCTVMEILRDIQDGEILYIPGVMTPTEISCAYNSGARIVKVYPVSVLGGEKYISALKRPFPHIPMVASQGITLDSMRRYIVAGAAAVVLSDAIFEKEAMRRRDFDAIYRHSKVAVLQGCQD